ncbi:Cytochrome c oxidase polypeptide 5, mitochondrial [Termitomyces sp. J132]|nr:Cytochrome c oxidase polypeptide 5, mitochondrial [Termitomyces sp. J132]
MKSSVADSLLCTDPLLAVFKMFGQLNALPITPAITIVPYDDLSYSVIEHAGNHDSDMIMLPWLPPSITPPTVTHPSSAVAQDGQLSSPQPVTPKASVITNPFDLLFKTSTSPTTEKPSSTIHSQFVRGVFAQARTDVALFVDRSTDGVGLDLDGRRSVHWTHAAYNLLTSLFFLVARRFGSGDMSNHEDAWSTKFTDYQYRHYLTCRWRLHHGDLEKLSIAVITLRVRLLAIQWNQHRTNTAMQAALRLARQRAPLRAVRRLATTASPSSVASSAPLTASRITPIPLANVEAQWAKLSSEEKLSVQEQLEEAAYYVAFGPHGPRTSISQPGDTAKIFFWTLALVAIGGSLFATARYFAPPPPKTISKEWEEATNARALEMKLNPITGISSEDYKGKGYVTHQ